MTISPENEQRIERRIKLEETVFIELLSAEADQNIIMCTSIDFSANGLQLVVDKEIPPDSVIRLCIDLSQHEPMFLTAEVRWVTTDPDKDEIRVGLSLYESEDSDIEDWQTCFADMLSIDIL